MKSILLVAIITFIATNVIAQTEPEPEEKDEKLERLGVRVGFVGTTGGLENSFGNGVNLTAHFMPQFKGQLFVDITFGAFFMGDTSRQDVLPPGLVAVPEKVGLRIITVLVAPTLIFPIGGKTDVSVGVGGGLYTVNLLLSQGLLEGDITNNQLGVYAAGGLIRQISTNWFLDIDVQAHKIFTGDDLDDVVYLYSDGNENPLFYSVTIGAMLRLF